MKEVTEWWEEIGGPRRLWLILGPGPAVVTRDQYDLSAYTTIGIAQIMRDMPVDFVSCLHPEALQEYGEAIDRNSRCLLMPRYPRSMLGESGDLLEHYFETYPVLQKLDQEGRLVWYNLSTSPQIPGSPPIQDAHFHAGVVLNLLGTLGSRRVRSLGIEDADDDAPSAAEIAARFPLDYAPLAVTPWRRFQVSLARLGSRLKPLCLRCLNAWKKRGQVLSL